MSLAHKIFATLKAGGTGTLPNPAAPSPDRSSTATATSASPSGSWNERFYHVAVQGCCHGELDRIYDACREHERKTGKQIDVLLCCGDFQAVRSAADMNSMAVPDKYKVLGDFHKYCTDVSNAPAGHKTQTTAPYLTIFVGGNHENSDLLAQESYGGFVAPNVFYLGHSSVVTVDNCLTIAGLSGIFKELDYDRPYPPRPYAANPMAKKAAYHVRRIEIAKLQAYLRATQKLRSHSFSTETREATATTSPAVMPPKVDFFLSHDWPLGITSYGDEAQLLRFKPYFKEDIRRGALGNPHTMRLLQEAKAPYWFAAHLHCHFEATVPHPSESAAGAAESTKFVALDKCAKGHGFLTFIDVPRVCRGSSGASVASTGSVAAAAAAASLSSENQPQGPHAVLGASRIRRDPVWLEVIRASHPFVAANRATGTRGGGGFDVNEAVKEVVASRWSPTRISAAALFAPTTETLLSALQLSPALPLQQMAPAAVSPAYASKGADDKTSPSVTWRYDTSSQNRENTQVHGRVLQPHHPRPRTETMIAPSVSTVAPASSTPLCHGAHIQPSQHPPTSALSLFEDVKPTGSASAPSSTSGMTSTHASALPAYTECDSDAQHREPAATTLSWFEDTTQ